jgi:hypothetical protein
MEMEMEFENGVDGKDKGKALTGKNTLNIKARDLQLKMQCRTDFLGDLPYVLNIYLCKDKK